MANKAISELPQAQNVNNQDLFVLEQSGIAKKLTAETFITEQGIIDALAEALDGHGGIQSVTLSSVSGRIRTYRITFTDQSATTFQVYDGTSIDRISRTSSSGLDDVYTIFLSDGTTTFFTVHNGADGDVSEAMLNDALKGKAPAITETTESGAIVNFTDGADDMPLHNILAEINPVQDLPYGDPYPAGSGKNFFGFEEYLKANNVLYTKNGNTYTVTIADASLYQNPWVFSDANVAVTISASAFTAGTATNPRIDLLNSDGSAVANISPSYLTNQGTACKARINWSATGTFTISEPMIELGNTKTAFAPYSNICPITGWTGCNVTRTGKNLLKPQMAQGTSSIVALGQSDATSFGTFLKAGTYTISVQSSKSFAFYYRAENGTENVHIGGYNVTSATFTLTEDLRIRFYAYLSAGLSVSDISNLQLELGSTATTYEPYITPSTVSLSWQTEAGTVYGGTIDVATGLLTVDRAMVTYNSSSGFAAHSSGRWYHEGLPSGADTSKREEAFSNQATYRDTNNNYPCFSFGRSGVYINKITADETIEQFSARLQANPMQICYFLATAQTYQLTPQEVIKTLLGTNNVWADTGNVTVTYPADTKMFIEKLTMPTEDDLVANQAITSGKYFMIGNSLYLALANIASGAAITIGTNAQRVSLADALNTINS